MRKILPIAKQYIWLVCFVILMVVGVYAAYERMIGVRQLPGPPLLLPWSLTAALDVGCGLALTTGGYVVAATIRVGRIERAQSLLRTSLMIAFLGYFIVCLGLIADQSVMMRICVLNSNWTPSGVSFAVNCAFLLFGMSVFTEFAPDVKQLQRWKSLAHTLVLFRTPLLWLGLSVSLFYQWVLGDALRHSSHALTFWASPWLVLLFFTSGTGAALAAGIMAYLHAQRSSSNPADLRLLDGVRRTLATLVFLYIQARFADLLERGQISLLHVDRQSSLLAIEIALFVIPMLVLASQTLPSPGLIYYSSAAILAGLICNRLNTFITSLEGAAPTLHLAPWHEFAVSYSIVVVGILGFQLLTMRFSVFGRSRAEKT